MTKPIRDDIIDNRRTKMGDVVNSYLPAIEHLDVSTGYFDLGGYATVRYQLEDALKRPGFRFRLLMGTNSITDKTPKSFEESVERITGSAPTDVWANPVEDATPLSSYLAAMNLESGQGTVNGLRSILDKDSVQVRYGKSRFNHSKCYILGEGAAIIGSSNFTRPGFGGVDGSRYNYELNASVQQNRLVTDVQGWFDDMWEMADDAKQDLIDILKDSKFGDPPKPFQIYRWDQK